MGDVVDIAEYRAQKNTNSFTVEKVKNAFENTAKIDFSEKPEKEIQKFYQDVTEQINDMVKNPCGATAWRLGKTLAEYKISTKDFDRVFNMLTSKEQSKSEESLSQEVEETIDTKIQSENDVAESEVSYEEYAKSQEDFVDKLLKGIGTFTDKLEGILDVSDGKSLASIPFDLTAKLAKKVVNAIKGLRDNQEFKTTTPGVASKLTSLFSEAEILDGKYEQAKPKFKSTPKKDVKVKGKAKKGFMQKCKERVQAKKSEKAKAVIAETRMYANSLEQLLKVISETRAVDLSQVKSADLVTDIKDVRETAGTTDLEKVEQLRTKVTSKQKKQIEYFRRVLNEIQTGKIKDDLRKYISLSENEIKYLIYGGRTGLNTDSFGTKIQSQQLMGLGYDGKLEISRKAPIKLEDIKGTPLEEELRKLAAMPRIDELTDEEVLQLSRAISVKDGKISIDPSKLDIKEKCPILPNGVRSEQEAKKVKSDFYRYVDMKTKVGYRLQCFKYMEGTELYLPHLEGLLESGREHFDDPQMYTKILSELDSIEQLNKSEILKMQVTELESRMSDLEKPNLTRKEKRTRSDLRKIAESKVAELEAQGIHVSERINKQSSAQEYIVQVGKGKLNLDEVLDIGVKKQRENESQSHDEK